MARARTTTHFLPKFENAAEGKRLTTSADGAAASGTAASLMCVSKKHSGSLVMAPPFYAKNSTGNAFSRLAALLLQDHFRAVWDEDETYWCFCGAHFEDGDAAFAAWWADAAAKGLSYSFECVAPRILGDHGATPPAAYVVLTAVARDGEFLSPARVLRLATEWRLPLVEALFVPWAAAAAVEDELRAARWTLANADADALFARAEGEGAVVQRFLTHEAVQGPVLEGFVIMELSAPESSLATLKALAAEYTATLAPYAARALDAALARGRRCLTEPESVENSLDDVGPSTREPRPAPADAEALWDFVCGDRGAPALELLFKTLRAHYRHAVKLKRYVYEGRVQVHVHVLSDEVFYGWRVHRQRGAAPLFRGMVVTFGDAMDVGGRPLDALEEGFYDDDDLRIAQIVKLKCLRYLVRTFAVRNKLSLLLDGGPGAYARKTSKNFCANWGVPTEHRGAVDALCGEWADYVDRAGAGAASALRAGSYLSVLEPFLDGREEGLGLFGGGSEGIKPAPAPPASGLASYFVVVCDLTYGGLASAELGRFRRLRPLRGKGARASIGAYVCVPTPPPKGLLGPSTLVVAYGPAGDAPSEALRKKHEGMWRAVAELKAHHRCADVFLNPCHDDFKKLKGPPPPAPLRPKTVVIVLGLPPGGGKSTFFAALRARGGGVVVASDEARKAVNAAPGAPAQRAEFEKRLAAALSGDADLVLFDKNVPTEDALGGACKQILDRSEGLAVSLAVVAPFAVDRDLCWARVRARAAGDVALNVHSAPDAEKVLDDLFVTRCSATLLRLDESALGAHVVRSDAFWGSLEDLDALAARVLETDFLDVVDVFGMVDDGRVAISSGGWLSAELAGTNLHVTLVSVAAPRCELLARSHLAGTACEVTLGAYHKATAGSMVVGFWEASVTGFDEHYAPQAAIYHVTDKAALEGSARPRHAGDALSCLRGLPSEHAWTFVSPPAEELVMPAEVVLR